MGGWLFQGETMTMYPVAAFNQLMLTVNSSDGVCIFAQNFASGSLLGLPTEVPARPSKDGVRYCRTFPRVHRRGSAFLQQQTPGLVDKNVKLQHAKEKTP